MKMSAKEQLERTEQIWGGDWKTRIRGLLHSQGYRTIQEFLAKFPAEPYVKVTKKLGDNVAGFQIIWLQYEEAKEKGNLRQVAADALAREISDKLKRGWGHKIHLAFNRANAFASWIGEIKKFAPDFEQLCEGVWKGLLHSNPPDNWVPCGPDDPIITVAFAKGWPILNPANGGVHSRNLFCTKCTAVLLPPGEADREQVCPFCGDRMSL